MKRPSFLLNCLVLLMGLLLVIANSCKKNDDNNDGNNDPVLSTIEVAMITTTTAVSGGNISSDGGLSITSRGVCWSTGQTPTIADSKTIDGSGTGAFVSSLSNLSPDTQYYVRAYATHSKGTSYGSTMIFRTLEGVTAGFPELSTTEVTDMTTTTALSGGTITSDGGSPVIARGVCWSTGQTPIISDNKTTDGSGTGTFSSSLSGLTPGTQYYVRAYATNSNGTGYGSAKSFSTLPGGINIPVLTTNEVTYMTTTTAISGGNISSDGGSAVTSRGVCWSISPTPTTADSKTTDGSGTGTFSSSLSELTPETQYYVRAYATNSNGTGYGNAQSFSTQPGGTAIPVLSTFEVTNLTTTTAKSGGIITSDGGSTVTSRGVCWSTGLTPTIADSKTTDGTGAGAFSSSMEGLTPGTQYYVRAYATNVSGTGYGSTMAFITKDAVMDGDGNYYETIIIGTQEWLAKNLKTTKLNDGTSIPMVTGGMEWSYLSTPGYSWYENQVTYGDIYGALYNIYSINTSKLCPIGWHVPSDAEWIVLREYLGGEDIAGSKLKEAGTAHWESPNLATNVTGFTALPGGFRESNFWNIRTFGYFWSSSSEGSNLHPWRMSQGAELDNSGNFTKDCGFSVRCVKD